MEMGGMHRAIDFMGDIGKCMEESGFGDILVEGNVYGPNVVQVILKGRSYNRGVRAHKLMNETMNRLKWKAFEKWLDVKEITLPDEDKHLITEDIIALRECLQIDTGTNDQVDIQGRIQNMIGHTRRIHALMNDFSIEGNSLSHTFKFLDHYVCDLSQLLLDYIAAKRDGNRDLELETFAEMVLYDFVCGHTNYARCDTLNVIEGQFLRQNKPEIHSAISNDLAAVYRTSKPFSGVWHDMAIEQSINKECGKFKQLYVKEEALQKYYLTAHKKAEVTQNMKRVGGYLDTANDYKESSKGRVTKDEAAVQHLLTLVEERMVNPFEIETTASVDEAQPLINIATSYVATDEIRSDLCNARELGCKRLQEFINDRFQTNKTDFMAVIPRQTVKTFASMNKPIKVKTREKVESINIDRQIFSRLSVIGQSREVDLKNLLQYELTPVPLSLFNLDGSIRKTTKSATLSWIEGSTAMKQLPENVNPELLVIDFKMLLRMICTEQNECKTFGEVSEKVSSVILGMKYRYTAVVGDNYLNEDSIKSGKRARRGQVQMQEIRNPTSETPMPRQIVKYLSNPKNKINLADYILTSLVETFKEVLSDKMIVYLGGGFKDYKKAVKVQKHSIERVESLESDHEEADSRMFLHIDYAVRQLGVTKVVQWSMDSDVAAMCPRICLLLGIKLYFKTGVRHLKRFIPMHDVPSQIGEKCTMALPVIHALSGCDSTSAFYGIGKKRWSTVMTKLPMLLDGIMELGDDPIDITTTSKSAVTQTVSHLYCGKQSDSIDDVRYKLFLVKVSEKLPPTADALNEHIKRVNYQSYIWKSSTTQFLNLPSPLDAGWTNNEDGYIVPVKMTQQPAPEALLDFTRCACKTDCRCMRCKCKKEGLLCTDACICDTERCINRIELAGSESEEDN